MQNKYSILSLAAISIVLMSFTAYAAAASIASSASGSMAVGPGNVNAMVNSSMHSNYTNGAYGTNTSSNISSAMQTGPQASSGAVSQIYNKSYNSTNSNFIPSGFATVSSSSSFDVATTYSNLLSCVGGLFKCTNQGSSVAQVSSMPPSSNQTVVFQDIKGNVAASSWGATLVVGGQTNSSVQVTKLNSQNITAAVDSRYKQQLSNITIGQKTNITAASAASANCALYDCLINTFLTGQYGFNYSTIGIENQSIFVLSGSLGNSGFAANSSAQGLISNRSNIAQGIASNNNAALGFVASATPMGLVPLNSTVIVLAQTSSTTFVSWQSSSAYGGTNSTVASQAAEQYSGSAFAPGEQVQYWNFNELHAIAGVSGDSYVQRFFPSQIKILKSGNATVVGATNLVAGVQNYLNTSIGSQVFDNVSIVPSTNMSSYALEIVDLGNSSSKRVATNAGYATYSYAYVNSTIGDSNIVNVTYSFNVSKQWIMQNKLNPAWVVLLRYNASANSWNQLATTQTGEDIGNYYFTAVSPGMSTYAIVSTSAPNAQQTNSTSAANGASALEGSLGSYYPYIIVLVIVLILAGLYMMRGKKGDRATAAPAPGQSGSSEQQPATRQAAVASPGASAPVPSQTQQEQPK